MTNTLDLWTYWDSLLREREQDALVGAHAASFRDRLASCNELRKLCRKHPTIETHRLIVWLYWYADMVERKTTPGVFGFAKEPAPDPSIHIQKARKHAWNLKAAQKLVERTPTKYFSADEWEGLRSAFANGIARAADGPTAVMFTDSDGTPVSTMQPDHDATSTHSGKPAFTGGDLNLYLAVLVKLLQEIPGLRNCYAVGKRLLDHFCPVMGDAGFQKTEKEFYAETLRVTVELFNAQKKGDSQRAAQDRKRVADKIDSMIEWVTSPEVRAICPVPSWVPLSKRSSHSVADSPP